MRARRADEAKKHAQPTANKRYTLLYLCFDESVFTEVYAASRRTNRSVRLLQRLDEAASVLELKRIKKGPQGPFNS